MSTTIRIYKFRLAPGLSTSTEQRVPSLALQTPMRLFANAIDPSPYAADDMLCGCFSCSVAVF
jgi:hypothetical protein